MAIASLNSSVIDCSSVSVTRRRSRVVCIGLDMNAVWLGDDWGSEHVRVVSLTAMSWLCMTCQSIAKHRVDWTRMILRCSRGR